MRVISIKHSRAQIYCREMRKKFFEERILRLALYITIPYTLISNFLSHCPPLSMDYWILSIMDSLDVVIRNCCYGVIAGIAFYFFNDFHKSIGSKIDKYNGMFSELHKLWWGIYNPLSNVNSNTYDESKDIITNIQYIYQYLYENKTGKEINAQTILEIPRDRLSYINYKWQTAQEEKKKFLEIYGNIISREEYSRMAYSEYDISIEVLKTAFSDIMVIDEKEYVCITERNLQRALYLMVQFEKDLAKMVNKYFEFYYGDYKSIKMPEII